MGEVGVVERHVARHIQSIERAVAVLRILGSAPHPLTLQEVADSLDLAKATTHGILGTLGGAVLGGLAGRAIDKGTSNNNRRCR